MKNSYSSLTEEEILKLPERFRGYLFSAFQFNLKDGYIFVPEDTFKEMIGLIEEYGKTQCVE